MYTCSDNDQIKIIIAKITFLWEKDFLPYNFKGQSIKPNIKVVAAKFFEKVHIIALIMPESQSYITDNS